MDEIFLDSWISNPVYGRIVGGLIGLLLGFVVARVLGKLALRFLQAAELNKLLKRTGFSIRAEQAISKTLETAVYAASVIYAFYMWGIAWLSVYAVTALIIIIGLAMLLALKDNISSLIAGFRIRGSLKEGEKIKVGNASGKVSAVRFTYTIIIGRNRELIAVPNNLLAKRFKH